MSDALDASLRLAVAPGAREHNPTPLTEAEGRGYAVEVQSDLKGSAR
ncbi:hypothetical protein ACWGSA_28650 [Streptomyces diastaticus]